MDPRTIYICCWCSVDKVGESRAGCLNYDDRRRTENKHIHEHSKSLTQDTKTKKKIKRRRGEETENRRERKKVVYVRNVVEQRRLYRAKKNEGEITDR